MEALIDLFWSRYADVRHAIEQDDVQATAVADRDLDPLALAICTPQRRDSAGIEAQFRFALDLLDREADDLGCVRRNAHLLRMLVERYVASESGLPADCLHQLNETSIIADATADGFLDDALLNRISDRVAVIAPGYRIFYSNETNARCLHVPREELVGRHLAEFVGVHRFQNEFKPSLDRCFSGENVLLTYADQLEGQTVVVHCRMSPFISGSSQIIGALLVIEETADRRRRPAA